MSDRQSVWKKEIRLLPAGLFDRVPDAVVEWLSAATVGAFVLAPALMAVLALFHQSIDYTLIVHPRLIQRWVYPLAALLGSAALLLALGKRRERGERLASILRRHPVPLMFLLLAALMIVSQSVNGWSVYALYGAQTREETFFMQLGYFLVLFPAAALLHDERKKRWLLRLHLAVSLLLAATAFVLWPRQTVSYYFYDWQPSFTSIYTNINYYAYYLSMAIPASAALAVLEQNRAWKLFALGALAVNAVALSVNDTMGGWVACAFALLFLVIVYRLLYRRFSPWLWAVVAVFLLSMVAPQFFLETPSTNFTRLFRDLSNLVEGAEGYERAGSGRWRIWMGSLSLIPKKPLLGYGMEGVFTYDLKEITYNTRPHNEFIQYALFYGIPAGALYFAGCVGVFLRGWRGRKRLRPMALTGLTAALGYLVSSCFGLTLFCTAPLMFLFLGMGYCGNTKEAE